MHNWQIWQPRHGWYCSSSSPSEILVTLPLVHSTYRALQRVVWVGLSYTPHFECSSVQMVQLLTEQGLLLKVQPSNTSHLGDCPTARPTPLQFRPAAVCSFSQAGSILHKHRGQHLCSCACRLNASNSGFNDTKTMLSPAHNLFALMKPQQD